MAGSHSHPSHAAQTTPTGSGRRTSASYGYDNESRRGTPQPQAGPSNVAVFSGHAVPTPSPTPANSFNFNLNAPAGAPAYPRPPSAQQYPVHQYYPQQLYHLPPQFAPHQYTQPHHSSGAPDHSNVQHPQSSAPQYTYYPIPASTPRPTDAPPSHLTVTATVQGVGTDQPFNASVQITSPPRRTRRSQPGGRSKRRRPNEPSASASSGPAAYNGPGVPGVGPSALPRSNASDATVRPSAMVGNLSAGFTSLVKAPKDPASHAAAATDVWFCTREWDESAMKPVAVTGMGPVWYTKPKPEKVPKLCCRFCAEMGNPPE